MRDIEQIDFGIWEKRYGRSLSDYEKREILARLGGFFRALIQIDQQGREEMAQEFTPPSSKSKS